MINCIATVMRHGAKLALTGVIISASTIAALAQPAFFNPFIDVPAIVEGRGATTDATLRFRYQLVESRTSQEEQTRDIIFDIADDWALVQQGDFFRLYDFKLSRVFLLNPDENSFVSLNRMANLMFLLAERQNRDFLAEIAGRSGLDIGTDGCDADAELGLSIPNNEAQTVVSLGVQGDTWALECNGHQVGELEISDDVALPAFWPAMLLEMPAHPMLSQKAMDSQNVPSRLVTNFRTSPNSEVSRVWTYLGAEEVDISYPLLETYVNATAVRLNELVGDGLGTLAQQVVAGVAGDGVPTFEEWDAYLGEVAQNDGDAALGFLIPNSLSMFPDLVKKCEAGDELVFCSAMGNLRQIIDSDPAVRAYYMVASMEQRGDVSAAVPFMIDAKSSKHADHPVLGGAFAQVLKQGGPEFQKRALEAGLPGDPLALTLGALRAYPYNPVYWTDLGDWYAGRFDHNNAFILYDVAFSVPIASGENPNLASRLDLVSRIKNDFPRYFLAR